MDRDEEFRWLFATEYPSVVRTIYLVVHDHARAEEIAQDAFVQLLRHWNKVRDYDLPQAWVRHVALRLAARDARRERRGRLLARQEAAMTPREPAATDADPDPDLRAAIRALPSRQRAVVVLFYFEDRPMDEIARIVGCSPSTCWVHLHRARKRLGALLAEEVSDDVR